MIFRFHVPYSDRLIPAAVPNGFAIAPALDLETLDRRGDFLPVAVIYGRGCAIHGWHRLTAAHAVVVIDSAADFLHPYTRGCGAGHHVPLVKGH